MKGLLALCLLIAASAGAAERRALLIGINDYTASRIPATRGVAIARHEWPDLAGAVNDVETIRQMLLHVYGFDAKNIATLIDQQATRVATLQAIETLATTAKADDTVLVYFAGHGSQVANSLSDEPDRRDESIVPADSRLGARDIRDKELRPLFNAILDRGARLTVILDKCHSGSGARGLPIRMRTRGVAPDLRDVRDGTRGPRPEDRGALVLAAAQDFDRAAEIRDEQGQIRGVFSWALIRAMRDAAPGESASETFLRARARMRAEMPAQEPVLAGVPAALDAPLLGTRIDRRGDRAVVAVEKVDRDGTVWLQGGWANGLSVGTELTHRLRITRLVDLGRSQARGETAVAIRPGSLLEVATWAPAPDRPLRLAVTRGTDHTSARVLVAAATRRSVRWVNDPSESTPTHVLRPAGAEWELLDGSEKLLFRGSAIAAIATLPRGTKLFVQFPAPAAIVDSIAFARDGIVPADRAEDADYILVGRSAGGLVEYAWVRPGVSAADRRRSALPPRTEWVRNAESLRTAVLRLRRIHGWALLDAPPGVRSPYRLTLRHARSGKTVENVVVGNERYDLVLRAVAPVEQRFTYVFVIDSFGTSTLLFPRSGAGSVENRLPLSLPGPAEIRLDASFDVVAPFGVDTYVLLTSAEALPDPSILQWDGVRRRGILNRGGWSIERLVVEAVPPRR